MQVVHLANQNLNHLINSALPRYGRVYQDGTPSINSKNANV
ncbi:hypothetical protein SBV1_3280008 [Verrucomicrobia bacterium]|nr:hypothetical protein SBV1_3280008 [Verrucomicrobiota bacterium]